jgi:aminopeptidase N
MLGAFETWRRYNPDRQAKMTGALKKVLAADDLSHDSFEMVTRILSH